ncbi:MAG: hypothetical protein AAF485_29385, partial [Chloroflexota bacterium]
MDDLIADFSTIDHATYPVIFRAYVVKSIQFSLNRIKNSTYLLTDIDREQALHNLSYALKWPEAWPFVQATLITMAPKMEQAGYRDEWIPYLEEGLNQAYLQEDDIAVAELHLQLGILYQLRAKYTVAHTHLEMSTKQFRRLRDTINQARALNRWGYIAHLQREFDQASYLAHRA